MHAQVVQAAVPTDVPMGEPVGVPMGQPAVPQGQVMVLPETPSTYGAGLPLSQPVVMAYPAQPVARAVYAPPPPPPPPPQMQQIAVTCPPNTFPGQTIHVQVQLASGPQTVGAQVPPGIGPGMQFLMNVPITPPPPAKVFVVPPPKRYYYRERHDDSYLLYGYGGLGTYMMLNSYHRDQAIMYNRPYETHHYASDSYDSYDAGGGGGGAAVGDDGLGEGGLGEFGLDDDVDFGDAIGDAYGEDTPLEYDAEAFEAEIGGDDAMDDAAAADADAADAADGDVDMYGGAGPTDLPDGGRGPGVVDALRSKRLRPLVMPTAALDAAAAITRQTNEAATRRAALATARADRPSWVDSLWKALVEEAEESVLGRLTALDYPSKPRVLCPPRFRQLAEPVELAELASSDESASASSERAGGVALALQLTPTITLVTQCSVDRLDKLLAQLTGWRGPASVALYIDAAEGSEEAAAIEHAALETLKGWPRELAHDLVLSLGYPPSAPPEAAPLYPINALRNLALRHAPSDLVFLVDVDFVPSAGARPHPPRPLPPRPAPLQAPLPHRARSRRDPSRVLPPPPPPAATRRRRH